MWAEGLTCRVVRVTGLGWSGSRSGGRQRGLCARSLPVIQPVGLIDRDRGLWHLGRADHGVDSFAHEGSDRQPPNRGVQHQPHHAPQPDLGHPWALGIALGGERYVSSRPFITVGSAVDGRRRRPSDRRTEPASSLASKTHVDVAIGDV